MKKFTPFIGLILIALLFVGCSNDNEENVDTVVLEQVQGKWQLTQYQNAAGEITLYADGPVMELNDDGTFTSNEENGFLGGTYTVNKKPGANLRLIFQRQWDAKQVFKHIDEVTATNLYTQGSSAEPMSDAADSSESYTWTRIP